ncbi:MAG: hypothetical protein LWW85_07530, partial [Marinilabiliales bacterium]|nr:hypothetical protein [Marinilabiliales bacterium]
ETGDGRRETGDGRRETGDRRPETGDRRRETDHLLTGATFFVLVQFSVEKVSGKLSANDPNVKWDAYFYPYNSNAKP